MQRKSLLSLIALLTLGLLIVLVHHLAPGLQPAVETVAVSECDLQQQSCHAEIPGLGPLVLTLTPRPILPLKPLLIDVSVKGLNEPPVIEFSGVSMDMGLNRTTLTALAPGHYRGEASLPVCSTGRMEWKASVLIQLQGRHLAIPFRFFSHA